MYNRKPRPTYSMHRSDTSRTVWPPPELEFLKMQRDLTMHLYELMGDYVPNLPHGCRGWEDGAFD